MREYKLLLIILIFCIITLNANAQVYTFNSQQRATSEARTNWVWTNWTQDLRYLFKINHDKDAVFVYCNGNMFNQYDIIDYIKITLSNTPATRYTCKDRKTGQQVTIDLAVFSEDVNLGNGLKTKGERYEIYLREESSVVCFKCF